MKRNNYVNCEEGGERNNVKKIIVLINVRNLVQETESKNLKKILTLNALYVFNYTNFFGTYPQLLRKEQLYWNVSHYA